MFIPPCSVTWFCLQHLDGFRQILHIFIKGVIVNTRRAIREAEATQVKGIYSGLRTIYKNKLFNV
jgi:hypothetical protein